MLLRFLLIVMVLYVPYQLRLPSDLGATGLNVFNLLFFATLWMVLADGTGERDKAPLKGRIIFFTVCLTIAMLITVFRSDASTLNDFSAFKNAIFYMLLYFLFFHAVKDTQTIRWVFAAILFVTFVAALQAARQGLDYGLGNYNVTRRAAGPFSVDWTNANRAGVYYAMFTPLFLAVAVYYTRNLWLRLAALGGVFMGVFAVFVTYSRQSYAIIAVVLLLLLIRRSFVVAILAVFAIMSYEAWAPDAAVQRVEMTQVQDQYGEEQLEESAESRFILWAGAAEMLKSNPLGVGFNRFKAEIGNYSIYRWKDAHNHYVLMAAETGIVGALSFVWLILGLLTLGLPLVRQRDNPEAQTLGLGYTAASVGMALGNLYGSPFFFGELMGNYWILTALVARYRVELEKAAISPNPVVT